MESEKRKQYAHEWWKNNRDKAKLYAVKRKDKRAEYWRLWQKQNPDKTRAIRKRYRQNHRAQLNLASNRFYHKHRERLLAERLEWRKKNRKVVNERARASYLKNRDKILKRSSDYNKLRYTRLRQELFTLLGQECCVSCGYSDRRALQFDHINGGGRQERKKFSGLLWLRYYIGHPDQAKKSLQILCANCNQIKKLSASEYTESDLIP